MESLREQQQQSQNMEIDDQQAFEVSFTKHRYDNDTNDQQGSICVLL